MIKANIIQAKRSRFFSAAVSMAVFLSALFLFHNQAFAGCDSVPTIMAEVVPCWFCPIFDIVFQAAGSYSYIAYTNVSGEAFSLLTICILFWLLKQLMEAMGSVAGFDPADFWKGVNARLFAAVFAGALLSANAVEVYGYLMSPMIEGAAGYGSALLGQGGVPVCSGGGASFTTMAGSAFSEGALNSLHCIIEELNNSVARGLGIGIACLCASWGGPLSLFPDLSMMCYGIAIILIYVAIMLVMPFYILDSCVRLGIVGAFMPLFIIAWVFPSTKWFAKAGWTMLVNSMMIIICMCIVLGLITAMIDNLIMADPAVADAFAQSNPKTLAELVAGADNTEGLIGIKLIACGIISFFMVSKVPAIGSHFSEMDSSSMDSMAQAGGAMSKGLQMAAKAAVLVAATVATGGAAAAPAAAGGAGAAGGAAAGGAAAGSAGAAGGAAAGGAGSAGGAAASGAKINKFNDMAKKAGNKAGKGGGKSEGKSSGNKMPDAPIASAEEFSKETPEE